MSVNPYAAPRAAVADAQTALVDGDFVPAGQAVATGNSWTWITESWRLFRGQPGMWIGGLLLLFLIVMLLGYIPYLGVLSISLLYPVLTAGVMICADSIWRNDSMEFGQFFAGFNTRTGDLLKVGVLYALLTLGVDVLMAVVAGLEPGYFLTNNEPSMELFSSKRYWIGVLVGLAIWVPVLMMVWFAPALIALNGMSASQSLKTSFSACLKNFLPLTVYGLLLLILTVVSAIPLGLGLFITMPLWFISVYTAYRDIFYLN